ncbi:MAG: histidinol-phosphate aminotransferase family protein [Spirochaetes bacterium]|nr:histidinol-phosphate aminotransferase family protein [Spirochaetota bacterium]
MDYFFRKDLKEKEENRISVKRAKVNLALNESNINPLSFFSEEDFLKLRNSELNRYPTEEYTEPLKDKLVYYLNDLSNKGSSKIEKEQILIANGIDDLLYYLFIALNEKGTNVLINVPCYPDYKNYGRSVGLNFIEIPLIENKKTNIDVLENLQSKSDFSPDSNSRIDNLIFDYDFHIDVKNIIKYGKKRNVKAIIFTNPNNPTGTLFSLADIIFIAQSLSNKLIILDEAYYEYSLHTALPYIEQFQNLIILRTFSKGFSSPGLRFGYLVGSAEVVKELKKVIPVFPVSQATLDIAKILIDKKDNLQKIQKDIINERERIFLSLNKIRKEKYSIVQVYKSYTNFISFKLKSNNDTINLYNFLQEKGISIRNVSSKFLDNLLRVTISSYDENEVFLSCVKQYFDKKN